MRLIATAFCACFSLGCLTLATNKSAARADAAPAEAPPADASPPTSQPSVSMVSLHLKHVVARDAFHSVTKQTGVRFATPPGFWDQAAAQNALDIEMTDQPFWAAVMDLCQKWNLHVRRRDEAQNVRPMFVSLTAGSGERSPASPQRVLSQGVLMEVESLVHTPHSAPGNSTQAQHRLTLNLYAYIDPAMHVETVDSDVFVQEAVDELGQSMLMKPKKFRMPRTQNTLIYECQALLDAPTGVGERLAHFKGALAIRTYVAMDSIVMNDPLHASDVGKAVDDRTFTVHPLVKSDDGNGYTLTIDTSGGDKSAWGIVDENLLQTAQLVDAAGKRWFESGNNGRHTNGGYQYTVRYIPDNEGGGPPGDPVKWTLMIPTGVQSLQIPFEFTDIPMP
jgi:hypothetical protein